MSEVKKVNVGSALTTSLALAHRGGQIATDGLEKLALSGKFSAVKEHPIVSKIVNKADMLWAILGLVLIFHGVQFKNLFLCTHVVMTFCYDKVTSSVLAVYSDIKTAQEKMSEDESAKADAKAEAKPENKHAAKRQGNKDSEKLSQNKEEAAAIAKKLLKVLDSDKITNALFEICVAAVACHMIMQGGLAKVIIIAHALVKASREKIHALLEFSGHEDMQAWTDLFVSFLLYALFGGMALVASPFALAMTVAACGAKLMVENGLRVLEPMGRIPGEMSAEMFADSPKGLAALCGLTAFGTLWQFWALVANSGMAWYFQVMYLPAYLAEGIISFL